MNNDDVMALANQTAGQHWMDEAHIQRFAALVAAAERRRLQAQRDALLEALKYHQEQTRPIQRTIDAIKAAEGEQR